VGCKVTSFRSTTLFYFPVASTDVPCLLPDESGQRTFGLLASAWPQASQILQPLSHKFPSRNLARPRFSSSPCIPRAPFRSCSSLFVLSAYLFSERAVHMRLLVGLNNTLPVPPPTIYAQNQFGSVLGTPQCGKALTYFSPGFLFLRPIVPAGRRYSCAFSAIC